MMSWDYLRQHPGTEKAARRIAEKAGRDLYDLGTCILLLKSPVEIVEAYQYIYRASKTLYILCDFILWLKRKGVRV